MSEPIPPPVPVGNPIDQLRSHLAGQVLFAGNKLDEVLKPFGFGFVVGPEFTGVVERGSFGKRKHIVASPTKDWLPDRALFTNRDEAGRFMRRFDFYRGQFEAAMAITQAVASLWPIQN